MPLFSLWFSVFFRESVATVAVHWVEFWVEFPSMKLQNGYVDLKKDQKDLDGQLQGEGGEGELFHFK